MSPYWTLRPEPGDGARTASRNFFMHIEEMVMSTFALLHGKGCVSGLNSEPARVARAPESPQWASGLVAAAGPQRDGGCSGPGEEVTSRSARLGRRLLGLLHKGRPRSPH